MMPKLKEGDELIFAIGCTRKLFDATEEIICTECGRTYYTDPKNRTITMALKMRPICLGCLSKMDDIHMAGAVHKGHVHHKETS